MNKIKLPSMVEYVFEIGVPGTTDKQFTDSVMIFANFLSQQPNIGMFVPAVFEDGEWRVLSEPKTPHTFASENADLYLKKWKSEKEQYQTALDNVIFEGFEYYAQVEYWQNGHIRFDEEFLENKTIEDLIPYSLTLTPKFAKELGLI